MVGSQDDSIIESENNFHYLPQDYKIDSRTLRRNNQDISINDYGQQLFDFCIAAKLRILDGRNRGDLKEHLTYIGDKGHSTVDLVLASEICLLQSGLIQYLSVLDLIIYQIIVPYISNFQVLIQSQLTISVIKLNLWMLH